MKALKTQLMAAIAMVLVAVLALSGATFAWFAVNTAVTATGLDVKTMVSSNLLISGSDLATGTKNADNTFGTIYEASLTGTQLEPVSTTTGKAFFFTTDAKADGSKDKALTGTGAVPFTAYNAAEVPTSGELTAFDNAYGTTGAVGYVDYVFQLMATNPSATAKDIKLTKLDMDYKQTAALETDEQKAYRVAVFVTDGGEDGSTLSTGSGTLLGVFAPTGAGLHGNKVVDSTTTINGDQVAANGTIASVPAGKTNYYKVVVRLYLEGQDTTCTNSTFMDLTKTGAKWTLDLELKLDTDAVSNTAVAVINKTTTAYSAP